MSSSIQTARNLAAQRAAKEAAERQKRLATARSMAYAEVTQTDPPSADEILSLCDSVGAQVDWFDRVCENCKRRLDQVAGINLTPGLRKQAEELEAIAATSLSECETAKEEALKAFRNVANPGDRTFSPFRQDATAEELATLRNASVKHIDATHKHWLAVRDAGSLRKQIAELERIDRGLIDHTCGLEPGRDFALPPLA